MCIACGSALFHHGMGRAVEKGVVGPAGLLTSVCYPVASSLCRSLMLLPLFSNKLDAYYYLFLHPCIASLAHD